MKAIKYQPVDSLLPPRILEIRDVPATKRPVRIEFKDLHLSSTKPISIKDAVFYLNFPRLVFALYDTLCRTSSFYVFSKPSPFVGLSDPICGLLLPNIYADGHICLGNVSSHVPQHRLDDLISLFWNSKFTLNCWRETTDWAGCYSGVKELERLLCMSCCCDSITRSMNLYAEAEKMNVMMAGCAKNFSLKNMCELRSPIWERIE